MTEVLYISVSHPMAKKILKKILPMVYFDVQGSRHPNYQIYRQMIDRAVRT
jgi:hypothetical protein